MSEMWKTMLYKLGYDHLFKDHNPLFLTGNIYSRYFCFHKILLFPPYLVILSSIVSQQKCAQNAAGLCSSLNPGAVIGQDGGDVWGLGGCWNRWASGQSWTGGGGDPQISLCCYIGVVLPDLVYSN